MIETKEIIVKKTADTQETTKTYCVSNVICQNCIYMKLVHRAVLSRDYLSNVALVIFMLLIMIG